MLTIFMNLLYDDKLCEHFKFCRMFCISRTVTVCTKYALKD